jgi:hypothetical protein
MADWSGRPCPAAQLPGRCVSARLRDEAVFDRGRDGRILARLAGADARVGRARGDPATPPNRHQPLVRRTAFGEGQAPGLPVEPHVVEAHRLQSLVVSLEVAAHRVEPMEVALANDRDFLDKSVLRSWRAQRRQPLPRASLGPLEPVRPARTFTSHTPVEVWINRLGRVGCSGFAQPGLGSLTVTLNPMGEERHQSGIDVLGRLHDACDRDPLALR